MDVHRVLLPALVLLRRPARGGVIGPRDAVWHGAVGRDGEGAQPARPLEERSLLAAPLASVRAKQPLGVGALRQRSSRLQAGVGERRAAARGAGRRTEAGGAAAASTAQADGAPSRQLERCNSCVCEASAASSLAAKQRLRVAETATDRSTT